MKYDMRICISSPPDRNKIVAEIFFGSDQWAELNQEEDDLRLEMYPRRDGRPWNLELEEVLHALNKAKERLIG